MHGGFYCVNLLSLFGISCVNLHCVDGENSNSVQNDNTKINCIKIASIKVKRGK